ncbi:hypothetical protein [Parafilimonas sp.]|uniref:hypothetical protein n=1 Tax=Parafilimonas sp. TaxID=1969739 RepID=UPI003F7EC732
MAIDNISQEEMEQMKQWLQEQALLANVTAQDYMGLILYKLFEFEQRLKKIEYNQQTHWVN